MNLKNLGKHSGNLYSLKTFLPAPTIRTGESLVIKDGHYEVINENTKKVVAKGVVIESIPQNPSMVHGPDC